MKCRPARSLDATTTMPDAVEKRETMGSNHLVTPWNKGFDCVSWKGVHQGNPVLFHKSCYVQKLHDENILKNLQMHGRQHTVFGVFIRCIFCAWKKIVRPPYGVCSCTQRFVQTNAGQKVPEIVVAWLCGLFPQE